MKHKIVHVIGNGDNAHRFDGETAKGTRLICNLPPFAIDKVHAAVLVDFKMMMALTEGSLDLSMYRWILGTRPKMWMEQRPDFHMRYAHLVRDFYTTVPKYAGNATNFNCGHMAVHYAANKLRAEEIHMYGFDSLFDYNMNSITDFYLNSDRSNVNNYRLLNNWRPVWNGIFDEFPQTTFILHHKHDKIKLPSKPRNVEIVTNG